MSDSNRSSGESPRNEGKLGGENAGHGLERDRNEVTPENRDSADRVDHDQGSSNEGVTRTPRQPSPGEESIEPRTGSPVPPGDMVGNTSETGHSSNTEPGAEIHQTRPRSPIGVGKGCVKPTGTMFIAMLSSLAFGVWNKRR